jgi:hypothetical protein
MMEAVRTSETSVDNHVTPQYIPEGNSEQMNIKMFRTIILSVLCGRVVRPFIPMEGNLLGVSEV